MKAVVSIGLVLSLVGSVRAQIAIGTSDLPSNIGDQRRAYLDSSHSSLSHLIGTTGGPQSWDFSYPQTPTDKVIKIQVVPATEGSCTGLAPQATFAERTIHEADGCSSWEFFSLAKGQGRLYHAMCDPCSNPSGAGIAFDSPTLELPDCTYGSSWQRTVKWTDTVDAGLGPMEVAVNFTSRARVDAYGTLLLPNLGSVPALRVNETNTYETFLVGFGIPLGQQYFHNLYWLVPGIGRAVHVVSKASSTAPPPLGDAPGKVLRVFESAAVPPRPCFVTNLAIQALGPKILLTWDSAGSGIRYVVARGLGGPVISPDPSLALALAQLPVPSPFVDEWVSILTNTQNFVVMDAPTGSSAWFYLVSCLPAPAPP